MSNKLYLLLISLNILNVYSFNLINLLSYKTRVLNLSKKNLKMCTNSYLDNLYNKPTNNNLQNITLLINNIDVKSNNLQNITLLINNIDVKTNNLQNMSLSFNNIELNNLFFNIYNIYRFK